MTPQIIHFAGRAVADFGIRSGRVLEVGSQDVNGSVRPIFENANCTEYIGIDIAAGPRVDRVMDAHAIADVWEPATFDTVVCCEMLEHDLRPWVTVEGMKRVLKPGGNLFVSTPTFGFPEHRHPIDCYRFGKDAYEGFIFEGCKILRLERTMESAILCCYGVKNA
jgi:SAM-dependent methyltransferase